MSPRRDQNCDRLARAHRRRRSYALRVKEKSPLYTAHRKFGARFFTLAGWVLGTLHVPEAQTLFEFLNDTSAFYRLTNMSLPDQPESLEFMALQRSAVLLVVPAESNGVTSPDSVPQTSHEVTCLFDGGLVMGRLSLPNELRVSDELMQSPDFFVLRDCTVGLDAAPDPVMEAEALVIVQASRMFGVAELSS